MAEAKSPSKDPPAVDGIVRRRLFNAEKNPLYSMSVVFGYVTGVLTLHPQLSTKKNPKWENYEDATNRFETNILWFQAFTDPIMRYGINGWFETNVYEFIDRLINWKQNEILKHYELHYDFMVFCTKHYPLEIKRWFEYMLVLPKDDPEMPFERRELVRECLKYMQYIFTFEEGTKEQFRPYASTGATVLLRNILQNILLIDLDEDLKPYTAGAVDQDDAQLVIDNRKMLENSIKRIHKIQQLVGSESEYPEAIKPFVSGNVDKRIDNMDALLGLNSEDTSKLKQIETAMLLRLQSLAYATSCTFDTELSLPEVVNMLKIIAMEVSAEQLSVEQLEDPGTPHIRASLGLTKTPLSPLLKQRFMNMTPPKGETPQYLRLNIIKITKKLNAEGLSIQELFDRFKSIREQIIKKYLQDKTNAEVARKQYAADQAAEQAARAAEGAEKAATRMKRKAERALERAENAKQRATNYFSSDSDDSDDDIFWADAGMGGASKDADTSGSKCVPRDTLYLKLKL